MGTTITLRRMTAADIPFGMRLAAQAGWNQTEADWRMILELSTGGSFIAHCGDQAVGTVTTVTYGGHFSWIGMLLVAPDFRRRGVGSHLLRAAIDYARPLGAVRLDATPAGQRLYERFGFQPEYVIHRLLRRGDLPAPRSSLSVSRVSRDMLPELTEFDAPHFGAARLAVLDKLLQRAPHYALMVRTGSHLAGFCLGRPGAHYDQLGPIVADFVADPIADPVETARGLVCQAIAAARDVILDVPAYQTAWLDLLQGLGFTVQRSFTRMALGPRPLPWEPKAQFAIAGPEIG